MSQVPHERHSIETQNPIRPKLTMMMNKHYQQLHADPRLDDRQNPQHELYHHDPQIDLYHHLEYQYRKSLQQDDLLVAVANPQHLPPHARNDHDQHHLQ